MSAHDCVEARLTDAKGDGREGGGGCVWRSKGVGASASCVRCQELPTRDHELDGRCWEDAAFRDGPYMATDGRERRA